MGQLTTGEPTTALRWRTCVIGCLLPIMLIACLLFGIAAVKPSLAMELAESRRGGLIGLTTGMTFSGVNIPLVLFAIYLGWEVVRFAWRWADVIAVRATTWGLVPHGSTLLKPMPWREIDDVSYALVGRAPSLVIKLRNGTTRTIRGIDNDEGAAEKFAAHARQLGTVG